MKSTGNQPQRTKTVSPANERYWSTLDNLIEGCQVIDREWRYLYLNNTAAKQGRRPKEELLGRTMMECFPGIETTPMFVTLQRCLKEQAFHTMENEFSFPDGTRGWYELRIEPVPEGLFILSLDITERKRAEEERSLLTFRNQALIHALSEIVYEWYPITGKVFWEGDYTKILGYTPEEMGNDTTAWESRIHPEDKEKIWTEIEKATKAHHIFEMEYRFLHRDGKYRWMHDRAVLFVNTEGKLEHMYGVFRDITGRKKLEEQMLRNQRMESIGTIAGGIAHDLNNMLGPIVLAIDILHKKISDEESVRLLEMLRRTAHRGAALVKQILTFGRGTEGERTQLSLQQPIEELKKFVESTFPSNIEITTQVSKDLWTVNADPTQIHQVLLNLAVNARDAMPNGGIITINAENITLDSHYAAMAADTKPGLYVVISVSDSGTGIPPDIQQRIFEPFFTTKEAGKGTGLGLSTVYSILKSHGGFINLYSEVGRGTNFRLYFPAVIEEEPTKNENVLPKSLEGRGECILLVEDEFVVREVSKVTLESNGYNVLLAADGIEAVSLFAQNGNTIDLIITDMDMPNMDGPTLIRTLQKMQPSLPFIGTSGLADKAKLATIRELNARLFLSKPYTAEKLLTSIAEVLHRK